MTKKESDRRTVEYSKKLWLLVEAIRRRGRT